MLAVQTQAGADNHREPANKDDSSRPYFLQEQHTEQAMPLYRSRLGFIDPVAYAQVISRISHQSVFQQGAQLSQTNHMTLCVAANVL